MKKLLEIGRAVCSIAVLALSACGSSTTLEGRYYSEAVRGEWLEFRDDGTVLHGSSGDSARYRVDGDTVVIAVPSGSVTGKIAGTSVLRFGGTSPFAGVWVAPEGSARPLASEVAQATPAELLGRWRIPGETHVFELLPDGTYTWGPDISGSYQVLEGSRIRRSFVQKGRLLNPALEERFAIDAGTLRMTLADGSVSTYERVQ